MNSSLRLGDGTLRRVSEVHLIVSSIRQYHHVLVLIKHAILWLAFRFAQVFGSSHHRNGGARTAYNSYRSRINNKKSSEEIPDDGRTRPKFQKHWIILSHMKKGLRWAKRLLTTGSNRQIKTERDCIRRNQVTGWSWLGSKEALRKKQLEDPDILPVLQWVEADSRPFGSAVCVSSPTTRHYWNLWSSLEVREGVLYRQFHRKDGTGDHYQLVVPRTMKIEIMKQMHQSLLSGHLGRKKTKEKAIQRYYWHGLREDINNWISQCHECSMTKSLTKTARAPLGNMVVGAPLDRLSADILGPLPETERGNRFILVVSDHFSKWTEIFPIPDFTAKTCADRILNEVIARFGCPYDLHTDQG